MAEPPARDAQRALAGEQVLTRRESRACTEGQRSWRAQGLFPTLGNSA
jgi:hypothetical protein